MSAFSTALIPVLAIILLGYALKRTDFISLKAWSGMEKLTYFVLFPALLIRTLGSQSLAGVPWPAMLLCVVCTLVFASMVLVSWYRIRSSVSGPTFTSIFQGGVRFNTYIALAIAQAYFGAEGLALGAVTAGFMIVLVNLFCVFAFAAWGENTYDGSRTFFREVFGNPLIVSCGIGWFLSLSGIGLPGVTEDILEIVGRAALPFGLLAVGSALIPRAIRGHLKSISIASLVQFGLKPTIVILLISKVGLVGIPAGVLIIFFMTPTAPSAYILARQLGGDIETMSSIITFQTILAFFVMPTIAFFVLSSV